MPPTHNPSSSPSPQTVESSDGKVADDDLNTKLTLLHNQSSDQAHAMSSVPKALGATKAAARRTRPPSGTRSASSRYSTVKGAATGKSPRVEAGQTQLTRLGFHTPSSSLPISPAAQAPATPSSADAMKREPGYYSTDASKTKHATPVTPKKGNNGVHFDMSPINKENDNNYYTPKQQDCPTSRAAGSSGILKQTSSPARHTTSSPGTPKREAKKPNKLVENMDEVQLYITYSRAYKELEAKMAKNPSMKVKDELQEKWTTKRKDMELTREQNRRLKKLYKQIQEEDKQRVENRKEAQEEAKSKQRSTASMGQDGSNVGKRNTSTTVKTEPPEATNDEGYEMTENVDSNGEDTN